MYPIVHKVNEVPCQDLSEVIANPSKVVRVNTPQAPLCICRLMFLWRAPIVPPCLGYLEVPCHFCELVYSRLSRQPFHHVSCRHKMGPMFTYPFSSGASSASRNIRLSPRKCLVAWWAVVIPFSSLVETATYSLHRKCMMSPSSFSRRRSTFFLSHMSTTLRNNKTLLVSTTIWEVNFYS